MSSIFHYRFLCLGLITAVSRVGLTTHGVEKNFRFESTPKSLLSIASHITLPAWPHNIIYSLSVLVETRGIEPPTFCVQSRCSPSVSYAPIHRHLPIAHVVLVRSTHNAFDQRTDSLLVPYSDLAVHIQLCAFDHCQCLDDY